MSTEVGMGEGRGEIEIEGAFGRYSINTQDMRSCGILSGVREIIGRESGRFPSSGMFQLSQQLRRRILTVHIGPSPTIGVGA